MVIVQSIAYHNFTPQSSIHFTQELPQLLHLGLSSNNIHFIITFVLLSIMSKYEDYPFGEESLSADETVEECQERKKVT